MFCSFFARASKSNRNLCTSVINGTGRKHRISGPNGCALTVVASARKEPSALFTRGQMTEDASNNSSRNQAREEAAPPPSPTEVIKEMPARGT
ncbi:unnamed protein product [Chondrus crispus]|uniref:Uncharacterized protein n=1 Tax=Chondrus crispus TaxID=2769 RepID=R7QQ61_CHOCR|nr:unnamed protein product [Chondrus crispus]CDF39495.1 unnamed protein product [Chondrus crispus]|eukprot:XP_005719406.1 unnamed protein product [Chondrus crispus]